jgi:hypothetical protein
MNFFKKIIKLYIMEKYKEDEIVWAKVKGYPWWPAIVKYIFNIKIF